MPKAKLKPGQIAPRSGQYERLKKGGGKSGQEVTVVRGEPLPPTPKKGQRYVIVDKTKHKR